MPKTTLFPGGLRRRASLIIGSGVVALALLAVLVELRQKSRARGVLADGAPEPGSGEPAATAEVDRARRILHDHLAFWAQRQVRGGWAQAYRLRDSKPHDGERFVSEANVVLQHECTPRIGLLFLRASRLLDEPSYDPT